MSMDAFLMRFKEGDVCALPSDVVVPVMRRFAEVQVCDAAVIATFPDGKISDQVIIERNADSSLTNICLPRIVFGPDLQHFAFALMAECKMCFFDESLGAIYSTEDLAAEIPIDLLNQTARGLVVVGCAEEIEIGA